MIAGRRSLSFAGGDFDHGQVQDCIDRGDGTGPEVLQEAIKVMGAAAQRYNITFDTTPYDFGGDRYLRTGEVLPDSATDELRKDD